MKKLKTTNPPGVDWDLINLGGVKECKMIINGATKNIVSTAEVQECGCRISEGTPIGTMLMKWLQVRGETETATSLLART